MIRQGCPFCAMSRGDDDSRWLSEGRFSFIIEPLNPVVPGHVLVIPKMHVRDFAEAPSIFGAVCIHAGRYADRKGGAYNLITSKGEEATQSVFHLHVHLVPRRHDDGLKLPWTDQEKNDG